MFVDILPETIPDDGTAFINFYLEEGEDKDAVLAKVLEELAGMREFVDLVHVLLRNPRLRT